MSATTAQPESRAAERRPALRKVANELSSLASRCKAWKGSRDSLRLTMGEALPSAYMQLSALMEQQQQQEGVPSRQIGAQNWPGQGQGLILQQQGQRSLTTGRAAGPTPPLGQERSFGGQIVQDSCKSAAQISMGHERTLVTLREFLTRTADRCVELAVRPPQPFVTSASGKPAVIVPACITPPKPPLTSTTYAPTRKQPLTGFDPPTSVAQMSGCGGVAGRSASVTTPGTGGGQPGTPGGGDPGAKRRSRAIQSAIVAGGGRTATFASVVGLEGAKQTLKEAVLYPSKFPHLFKGENGPKPWQCVLLYGPPGTGKSKLAEALAGEIDSTFYKISSSDLISQWVGESEKLIRALFDEAMKECAQSQKPGIIFIDEIDSLCRARRGSEEESTRRVKTELMVRISNMCSTAEGNRVFLLGATNCPWDLDSAFLRRFQKRVYVALPDLRNRREMLMKYAEKCDLAPKEWSKLAESTGGLSCSDLVCLAQEALLEPLRQLTRTTSWLFSAQLGSYIPAPPSCPGAVQMKFDDMCPSLVRPRKVKFDDFLLALRNISRTVTDHDLAKYSSFGASGST